MSKFGTLYNFRTRVSNINLYRCCLSMRVFPCKIYNLKQYTLTVRYSGHLSPSQYRCRNDSDANAKYGKLTDVIPCAGNKPAYNRA